MTPLEAVLTFIGGAAVGGMVYLAGMAQGSDVRTARARRIAELEHAARAARLRAARDTARPPAPLPLFPAPPRSTMVVPRDRDYWLYVKPPGPSSFEWAGAGWATPTALDFEPTSMHARRVGAAATIPEGEPIAPMELVRAVVGVWAEFRRVLDVHGVVVDHDARVGVSVERGDLRSLVTRFVVRAKCWPAVEGVTVPRRPGWQDVTR